MHDLTFTKRKDARIKNNDFDEAVCARERQGNKDIRKQRKIQVTTIAERRDQ